MDLLIQNARLLGTDSIFEIEIEDGSILRIQKGGQWHDTGKNMVDAKGGLVLPTFVEPHVHLDKAFLAEKLKEAGSIAEARQMLRDEKKSFTIERVRENAERAISWALENGVTFLRTHVDVDRFAGTRSVEAILELKKKYEKILDIQIVAFPQEGVIKDPETVEYLEKALDLGASVLGGMPEAETSIENSNKHIDILLSTAKERGIDLDVHCDVLPGFRNIEYLASKVLDKIAYFEGRVTVDHLIALSYYDTEHARKIIAMIRDASINVVSNPCTMITSGATEKPPLARGITLVKDLVQAGVNVAYGSDNLVDPYNPFGDLNPLTNGFLLAYGARMNSLSDCEQIIGMATYSSAKIMRLGNYGLRVGCAADLNVYAEIETSRELIRRHWKPNYVVKKGKIIMENNSDSARRY